MIERSQIEKAYTGDALEAIKESLDTLSSLGFFQTLITANQYRVVQGFDSPDVEELAKQISEARQENRVLATLQSLFPPQSKGNKS